MLRLGRTDGIKGQWNYPAAFTLGAKMGQEGIVGLLSTVTCCCRQSQQVIPHSKIREIKPRLPICRGLDVLDEQ